MGYARRRSIAEMFDPAPVEAAALRIAARWQTDLLEQVRMNTPIAKVPDGASPSAFAGGRGRTPGTLRDSWERGGIERRGNGVRVTVFTRDSIARFVEYPTRSHEIRPRADRRSASVPETGNARRRGRGAALRFLSNGRVVFRTRVRHPGTRGVYMMTRAVAEVGGRLDRAVGTELRDALRETVS